MHPANFVVKGCQGRDYLPRAPGRLEAAGNASEAARLSFSIFQCRGSGQQPNPASRFAGTSHFGERPLHWQSCSLEVGAIQETLVGTFRQQTCVCPRPVRGGAAACLPGGAAELGGLGTWLNAWHRQPLGRGKEAQKAKRARLRHSLKQHYCSACGLQQKAVKRCEQPC